MREPCLHTVCWWWWLWFGFIALRLGQWLDFTALGWWCWLNFIALGLRGWLDFIALGLGLRRIRIGSCILQNKQINNDVALLFQCYVPFVNKEPFKKRTCRVQPADYIGRFGYNIKFCDAHANIPARLCVRLTWWFGSHDSCARTIST